MTTRNFDESINNIPAEKLKLAVRHGAIHDTKFETKPVGFFKDAFSRFKKNKGSLVAAVIIIILVLFAILVPIFSGYTVSYNDKRMDFCYPKSHLSEWFGWDFWDGCVDKSYSKISFEKYYGMGVETGHNAIKNQKYTVKTVNGVEKYFVRFDTYHKNGCIFLDLDGEQYELLQQYQNETGIQVIYPITVRSQRPTAVQDSTDANYWYKTKTVDGKTVADLDENGDYVNIYAAYSEYPADHVKYPGEPSDFYHSITIESDREETRKYLYAEKNQTGFRVRVNYFEYYTYNHSYVLKDGITEPFFLFGTDDYGKDLLTCLSGGARLSFILAIVVSAVNMIVGAIYGAIEGYYGGAADLIMERISDILSAIPFMIVITLLKLHMSGQVMQEYGHLIILFIAFFLTGWIGMAGSTRMQFYRFKNQEYVLAARTLGARDKRIMFKHIFPNAIGTLVTSCALIIPSMIYSETSLTYLGIVNLSTGNITSVGTIIANGQPVLTLYPHITMFPTVFLVLLMLSFNLFGNGLRDAFNPSLRGSEE